MDFEWQCINLALDNRINKPGIDVQPYSNVGRRLLLPNTPIISSLHFLLPCSLISSSSLLFSPILLSFFYCFPHLISPSFLSLLLSNSSHTLPFFPPSFLTALVLSGAVSSIQKLREGDSVSPFTLLFCFCISVLTAALSGACSSRRHLDPTILPTHRLHPPSLTQWVLKSHRVTERQNQITHSGPPLQRMQCVNIMIT